MTDHHIRGVKVSLRKKIADSEWFNRTVEGLLAGWIRFAHRTSQWERLGFEPMENLIRSGEPVIVVLWHQRLMMAPYLFDPTVGPICTLTSASRAGRLGGKVVERFGLGTMAMASYQRHVSLSRAVLGQIKKGVSVGIAADGPRGPARQASAVPITWARASRKRVFLISYSANRVLEVPTWDRMWFPAPWSRGVLMCREWEQSIPRFPTEEETEDLRLQLQAELDDITNATDRKAGRLN